MHSQDMIFVQRAKAMKSNSSVDSERSSSSRDDEVLIDEGLVAEDGERSGEKKRRVSSAGARVARPSPLSGGEKKR